jgi:hypothetical protein
MAHFLGTHTSSCSVNLLYIDPGAGSMVIQAALAAALAIPFFFRTHISRAVQRLREMRGPRDETRTPGG